MRFPDFSGLLVPEAYPDELLDIVRDFHGAPVAHPEDLIEKLLVESEGGPHLCPGSFSHFYRRCTCDAGSISNNIVMSINIIIFHISNTDI